MLRIAAVGDLHFSERDIGRFRADWRRLADRADVLLLAGDLTQFGTALQGFALAAELEAVRCPVVAVLGNHDWDAGEPDRVRDALEDVGVTVLEGESVVLRVGSASLGIAGCKGFGGGFGSALGHAFGEPEMKRFMGLTEAAASGLERNLRLLRADHRIALTHYSPIVGTLAGEDPAVHAFLGSSLLGEAVDRGGADLAIHGHSHRGIETGRTPGGVPVRNVALPVLGRPFSIYRLERPELVLAPG